MDEILEKKIKICKISQMKNPTILMNEQDLEDFKKKLKSEISGFEINRVIKYRNIPIKTSLFIKRNQVFIYDDLLIF